MKKICTENKEKSRHNFYDNNTLGLFISQFVLLVVLPSSSSYRDDKGPNFYLGKDRLSFL